MLKNFAILFMAAGLMNSPAFAQREVEVMRGEVLIRNDVSDDRGRTYLLIAIDSFDKFHRTDGLIDDLWLIDTTADHNQNYVYHRLEDALVSSVNQSTLTVTDNGDDSVIANMALEGSWQRGKTAEELSASRVTGFTRYYGGFERGLDALSGANPLVLPWDLGPLFIPEENAEPFAKTLTPFAKALELCEKPETGGHKNCSAVCSFGNCKATCSPPTSCPCCKCAMKTMPTCACVSCSG